MRACEIQAQGDAQPLGPPLEQRFPRINSDAIESNAVAIGPSASLLGQSFTVSREYMLLYGHC